MVGLIPAFKWEFRGASHSSREMTFHRGRRPIRDPYEEHFLPMDQGEVRVHRIVNIVDKRFAPRPEVEYERGYGDEQYYDAPRHYQDVRGYHSEDSYEPNDRRPYDESPQYRSYRRCSPPPRNLLNSQDGQYSQPYYSKDDLRHHLSSRSSSRGQHFRRRGRGQGPHPRNDHTDYRAAKSLVITRERSPQRRDAPPNPDAGSNASRNFSPDGDKRHAHHPSQQPKRVPFGGQTGSENSSVVSSHAASSFKEGSPHSTSSKDQTQASMEEPPEEAPEEVLEEEEDQGEAGMEPGELLEASGEPTVTSEDDLKTRRLEAIRAKALEIEEHYRQDCETFRTVVKMLIDKEPSLDSVLQEPLDKNLTEIKQHCLNSLKNFITELDEILGQQDNSE